jgi:hypothetical protein
MSRIIRPSAGRISSVPPPPDLTPMSNWSNDVAKAVDVQINPLEFDDYGHGSQRFAPMLYADDWVELQELRVEYAALPRGEVRAEDLLAWLLPLSVVVRNPPSKEDVLVFCVALVPLLDSCMPRWVLNTETQRLAARKWQFFPAAADFFSLIDPIWQAAQQVSFALLCMTNRAPRNPEIRPDYAKAHCLR